MSLENLPSCQILAMLHTKGLTMHSIAKQHNFEERDVFAVISGKEFYPNIANTIAKAVNAEPYMLWPTLYPVPKTQALVFILRVHCE